MSRPLLSPGSRLLPCARCDAPVTPDAFALLNSEQKPADAAAP